MTTTNITNFRKNAFNYVEQTVKYNGNAVSGICAGYA